jgi:type IV secretion system protein VirB11
MIKNEISVQHNPMAQVSLEGLLDCGMINNGQLSVLEQSIADKSNILISGAVGSGKSTFLQAISNQACIADLDVKVVIVQQADEIKRFETGNYTSLIAKPPFDLAPVIDAGLRFTPDLLIVGDLRTTEIKELLNSSVVWASCINADSPLAALHNLEEYSKLSGYLPSKDQIAEQVRIVVHVEHVNSGHQITSISQVSGYSERGFMLTRLA